MEDTLVLKLEYWSLSRKKNQQKGGVEIFGIRNNEKVIECQFYAKCYARFCWENTIYNVDFLNLNDV